MYNKLIIVAENIDKDMHIITFKIELKNAEIKVLSPIIIPIEENILLNDGYINWLFATVEIIKYKNNG